MGSLIGSCVVGIPLGFFLCNEIAEIPGLSYGNTAQKSKHDTARHDIIKILSDAGIKASVIGRTTADHNKILRNDDEVRYLDTPNRDEVYRFI